jgi:surface protein
MFLFAVAFNGDISKWNTSNVFSMRYMFAEATSFNCDISKWDTSLVLNMSYMFYGANAFNSDITKWNTSNVQTMKQMFSNNTTFNQDISGWDTSSVSDMTGMFKNTKTFNQDISKWDTSSVTVMANMFSGAVAFNKYPGIANWDFSNIIPYTASPSNQNLEGYWGLYNFIYNVGNKNPEAKFSTFIQNLSNNKTLPYNIDLGYTGLKNKISDNDILGKNALTSLRAAKSINHLIIKQKDEPPTTSKSNVQDETLNEEVNVTFPVAFDKSKVLAKKI